MEVLLVNEEDLRNDATQRKATTRATAIPSTSGMYILTYTTSMAHDGTLL